MEAVNSTETFEHLFRNQKADHYLITIAFQANVARCTAKDHKLSSLVEFGYSLQNLFQACACVRVCVCVWMCMRACMCVCVHVHVHTCMCMHVCMRACTCVCVCVCIGTLRGIVEL